MGKLYDAAPPAAPAGPVSRWRQSPKDERVDEINEPWPQRLIGSHLDA